MLAIVNFSHFSFLGGWGANLDCTGSFFVFLYESENRRMIILSCVYTLMIFEIECIYWKCL